MSECTLAKATVYGLGLGRTSRQARLRVRYSDDDPDGIICQHDLQERADHGLEWREQDFVLVDPTETRDRETIQPSYSPFPDARLVCDWHEAAPRAYVNYQERTGGQWVSQRSWEIHPVEGVVEVVGDGGGRAAEGKSVPDCPECDRRLAIVDDETYACYNCMERHDRNGVGEVVA